MVLGRYHIVGYLALRVYVICMYYTTRIPMVLVYEV